MISAGRIILVAAMTSLPMIIGVAFFCCTQYGMFWRFKSLDWGIIMLWASMNGDEIQNLYHFMKPLSFLVTAMFCYLWVFFGNNFITPFFLAINEDGYID